MVRLTRRRGREDQKGAVALLVAVMALTLFTICGFVIDLGQARVVRRHAQNGADAAALAAGNALYLAGVETPDLAAAVAAAKQFAAENYRVTDADWAGCHDPFPLAYQPDPDTSCISFDSATDPLNVRVVMPQRQVATPFASLVGVHSVTVAAQAKTTLHPGGKAVCGLCIVGDGYHDLQNGDAVISGGSVSVNGDVNIQSHGLVSTDGTISVEGVASGPLDGYTPDPLQHQLPVEDPLATVPLPSYSTLTVKSDPCGTGSGHGPGVYGGWNFPNSTCVLQPGLYVVTGQWSFTGSAALDGSAGVTLYFVCGTTTAPRACHAPGEDGGWLDANGNGDIVVKAPSSGDTQGMAIVYDRLNTSELRLTGNGASDYEGTIYALSANMEYDGNSCSDTYQALIIVDSLEFNGEGTCLASHYSLEKNVYVPPSQLHLSQ